MRECPMFHSSRPEPDGGCQPMVVDAPGAGMRLLMGAGCSSKRGFCFSDLSLLGLCCPSMASSSSDHTCVDVDAAPGVTIVVWRESASSLRFQAGVSKRE